MDFYGLLISTGVVALAEIGDKTQLLSLMLAARYPKHAWPIIWGILLATLFNHALAAYVGHWVAGLLSPDLLRWILGIGFLALGAWLLIPDKLDEDQATKPAKGAWAIFVLRSSHSPANTRGGKVFKRVTAAFTDSPSFPPGHCGCWAATRLSSKSESSEVIMVLRIEGVSEFSYRNYPKKISDSL